MVTFVTYIYRKFHSIWPECILYIMVGLLFLYWRHFHMHFPRIIIYFAIGFYEWSNHTKGYMYKYNLHGASHSQKFKSQFSPMGIIHLLMDDFTPEACATVIIGYIYPTNIYSYGLLYVLNYDGGLHMVLQSEHYWLFPDKTVHLWIFPYLVWHKRNMNPWHSHLSLLYLPI